MRLVAALRATETFLRRRAIPIVAAVTLGIVAGGAGYALYLGDSVRYFDEREYLDLASSLARHGVFSFDGKTATALRPPAYPFLLSVFDRAGAGLPVLRWLQFLGLGVSVLLVTRLAGRLGGGAAAALAALLTLTYPVEFYAAGTFYPQAVAGLLLLLALDLLSQREDPRGWHALAASGCFGVLILSVPSFVFSFSVALAWLVARGRASLRAVLCFVVPAVLVVGAWSLRNYAVLGAPVFVSTNSGWNLLLGNSENTTPSAGTNVDLSRYEREATGNDEVSRDAFYRQKAGEWIAHNELAAAKLYGGKVLHYFAFRDQLATRDESSTARDLLMLATYGPLLALLALRLVALRQLPAGRLESLLLALYVGNAFFMALFFCRIRFRLPLDLILIAIDANFVVAASGWLTRRASV
jgi:4-amino-4-deoxy-L-arabinose transferase-like glycosyltransferase